MKQLLFFSLMLGLLSCGPTSNEKMIQQVDSLLTQVNEANEKLSEFNPSDVSIYVDSINFDVRFIQQEYQDTMDLATATKVDAYYRNVKSITKFKVAYDAQAQDIRYSLDQMNDLKADLANGMVDSVAFAEYFPKELEAVKRIEESNFSLKRWYEIIQKNQKTFKPPIDSLITSIKQKRGY